MNIPVCIVAKYSPLMAIQEESTAATTATSKIGLEDAHNERNTNQ